MFADFADGVMLPAFIVYKANNLYFTSNEGATQGTRFNCTKTGWFDAITFGDWVKTIALPYLKKGPGKNC